jgi:hypothetical protein
MPHFNNISIKWQKSVLLVKKLEYQEKNTDMMSQVIKLYVCIKYMYISTECGKNLDILSVWTTRFLVKWLESQII